ncbi:bile acid:sodium symporter [Pelagicoccus sp. SDUM812003]|uniref:bile acid:sodium symporter n=1 Tax=Pelagicoccus sp. SDUM812003 TaxID=3041267 RepID=UPI00280FB6C7|nr:bile acid:sodium symporter [Pelagicoccus sp. SDUM812003]MDQ8201613.1 bile acid:sodium symporter [Pelagicoccus sp. SDUM812003]
MITPLEESLLKAMILFIMFGLGCSLSTTDFKEALKNPKAVIVGFLSQYLIMPALAFGMAKFFEMSNAWAIGIIIVACCPSGTTSSLFNYFAKGDLALSISLSSITTGAALLAMPILLTVYTAPFEADNLRVDIKSVMLSLVACLLPVAGGMYLRYKSERWAKNMEETGAALGIIVILFLILSWLPRNFDSMINSDASILFTSIGLGLGGFLFGYYFSRFLGMNRRRCRTVALETGIQNGPLAFAIILLSFPDKQMANTILWPALLYSFFIVNTATVVTYFMRRLSRKEWFHFENDEVKNALFTQGWLRP